MRTKRVLGVHPGENTASFASGVGARSTTVPTVSIAPIGPISQAASLPALISPAKGSFQEMIYAEPGRPLPPRTNSRCLAI
jgi:hypothetical protein